MSNNPTVEDLAIVNSRDHLIDFCVVYDKNYEVNYHHRIIAEELEDIATGASDVELLVLECPPRHGKSHLASIYFPAWYLGRNPDKEIITSSYSGELSAEFGSQTRNIINDAQYKVIFNTQLRADSQAKDKWKTEDGGGYLSVGRGGATTGHGANIFLIDDPFKDREEADSKLIRDKVFAWYRSVALTRLEKDAVIIIIMTRWHPDDLVARAIQIAKESGQKYKVITFPAIATADDKYRKRGDALWPNKYPINKLEQKKKQLGPYEWSALYQQNPIATENQEFKAEWFQKISRQKIRPEFCGNYLTIDTAMSEKTSADFTGFCENLVDMMNNWNLSAYQMKLNPKDLVDYLFTLYLKRKFKKIGIEKTAYTWGLKPYLDEQMRQRNIFLPIVELDHRQTQKEIRIRGLIPRYASGSIYHFENECMDLEEELLNFPKSKNDDVSDAVAYQLQLVEPQEEAVVYAQPKPAISRNPLKSLR